MNLRLSRFAIFAASAGLIIFSTLAFAQSFVGTVIAVQGDVKVFHVPLPGDRGPFARLQNQVYAYHDAKLGERLNPGELILCGPDGKIRVVYPNGDTFFVGHSSSFVMPIVLANKSASNDSMHRDGATKSNGDNSLVKMFYGQFRALISKKGPRNRLKVVTRDAVSGVRGTDFFVSENATSGTHLTVIRGAVAIQTKSDPKVVRIVKTDQTATAKAQIKAAPQVNVASREALAQIRAESKLNTNESAIAALPKAEQQDIHNLQKKAFESVVVDIRGENPALYKAVSHQEAKNVDQVDNIVMAQLINTAPPAKTAIQPKSQDKLNAKPADHIRYRHPVVR